MEGKQQVMEGERDETGADDGEGADHGDRQWESYTATHLTCPAHHTHQPNAHCLFGSLFKLLNLLYIPLSVSACISIAANIYPYSCVTATIRKITQNITCC